MYVLFMKNRIELDQKYLKSVFDYNPNTGDLSVRKDFKEVKSAGGQSVGGGRYYPGKIVGTLKGRHGHLRINVKGKVFLTHRVIFMWMTGKCPKYIDHIDRNPSNNCWSNLRECTQSQNAMNQKFSKVNKSGFKGVRFYCGAWRAYIMVNYKQINLGRFNNMEDAIKAREAASIKYHQEYSGELTLSSTKTK